MPYTVRMILQAVYELPDFVRQQFTGPNMVWAITALVVFLVVLFFTNRFTSILREIFVFAAIITALVAYFKRRYVLIWLAVIVLLVLGIFRLIRYIIVTTRQNRINRSIEERALEKAERRRGSWKNKMGYSGETRPIDLGYIPGEMTAEELADVVENETLENQGATILTDTPLPAETAAAQADTYVFTEEHIPQAGPDAGKQAERERILQAVRMLKELRDLDVLTEQEFTEKRAMLYARLG